MNQSNTTPNSAMATLTGVVLLGLVAGGIWLFLLLLEGGFAALGDSLKYFIWTPMVLFFGYLVGNGWMENRKSR